MSADWAVDAAVSGVGELAIGSHLRGTEAGSDLLCLPGDLGITE